MENAVMTRRSGFGRFIILWSGELVSAVGTGLTAFALSASAYMRSEQASDSVMILVLTFLPSFLIRPLGGVLADRQDRRLLMIIGNIGSALGILMIFLSMNGRAGTLWSIAPGLVLSSLCAGILNPAYKASVSDFLPPELYEKASGLVQLSAAAPLLLSPLLAAVLMVRHDLRDILLLDALSFLVSALIIHFIRLGMDKREKPHSGSLRDLKREFLEGWSTIRSNRGVFRLTVLVACILFFVSLLQALLTPMVLSFSTVVSLGKIQTICACGILAGSMIIGSLGGFPGRVRNLAFSLACMGLFYSFIGFRESLVTVIVPGLLFFLTLPFVNTGIEVLIRRNIDNKVQGRAWAMISFISYSGALLAFASAGFLADRVFNPMLMDRGVLVPALGGVFGVGKGRGIALLFSLSGGVVILLSLFAGRSESIRALEESC